MFVSADVRVGHHYYDDIDKNDAPHSSTMVFRQLPILLVTVHTHRKRERQRGQTAQYYTCVCVCRPTWCVLKSERSGERSSDGAKQQLQRWQLPSCLPFHRPCFCSSRTILSFSLSAGSSTLI